MALYLRCERYIKILKLFRAGVYNIMHTCFNSSGNETRILSLAITCKLFIEEIVFDALEGCKSSNPIRCRRVFSVWFAEDLDFARRNEE